MALKSGLYIVATPIGHLSDITLRALDILKNCDGILCEDTRKSQILLKHYGIQKKLFSYHDHTLPKERSKIINLLLQGKILALISDAGSPLIADPGYKLVQECIEQNIYISSIPGSTAFIGALQISGMPCDQFAFCGFAEEKKFIFWQEIHTTLIFYEAPHRLIITLQKMQTFFKNRHVAVVRELTKVYEECIRGSFHDVIEHFKNHSPKGEIIVLLSPPKVTDISDEELNQVLLKLLKHYSLKETSQQASIMLGVSKKRVYQQALTLLELTTGQYLKMT